MEKNLRLSLSSKKGKPSERSSCKKPADSVDQKRGFRKPTG